MKKLVAAKGQVEQDQQQQPPPLLSPISIPTNLSPSSTQPSPSPSSSSAPPSSPQPTLQSQQQLNQNAQDPICLYCVEKIYVESEPYCQLGRGSRYWHTKCVESSKERKETTMMLMHSMNQLASNFFGRLSGAMTTDTEPDDDVERSTSNTSDLDTEGLSEATEGDITIREGRTSGGARPRKTVITVWDDSDVSDADSTLRGINASSGWGSMTRGGGSGGGPNSSNNRTGGARPPVEVTTANSSPSPSPYGTVRRSGFGPLWGVEWRPQASFYRSLSFEFDSAGNTIRPKPKRSKSRDKTKEKEKEKDKDKARKDKHHGHHRKLSAGGPGGSGQLMPTSSISPMVSPKRHGLNSSSSSSLSSDDDDNNVGVKDRVRKRKKSRAGDNKNANHLVRSNKCATCAEAIGKDDNYVFVSGNKYHIDCFFCSSCLRPRFYEMQNGKIACLECLPQCDGCGLPLIPSNPKHGKQRGGHLHSAATGPAPNHNNGGLSSSLSGSGIGNKENVNSNSMPVPPLSGDEHGGGGREKGNSLGGGGGGGGGTAVAVMAEEKEDGEKEMVVELDGVVQRYHRKCILKCSSCKQPIQRKRGKTYKKQGKPWCAKCISKCSVFEDRAFMFTKALAVSKSRSASLQGSTSATWPNTMEELLGEEVALHSFIDFLVNDYSVENILFYLDVESFKRLKRKQDIIIQANNIYNKYLITDAELEVVAIDAEERKKLIYILANKTGKVKNNFFEGAQKHISSYLKENAFPRYLKSEEHKTLLKGNGLIPRPASPSTTSAS